MHEIENEENPNTQRRRGRVPWHEQVVLKTQYYWFTKDGNMLYKNSKSHLKKIRLARIGRRLEAYLFKRERSCQPLSKSISKFTPKKAVLRECVRGIGILESPMSPRLIKKRVTIKELPKKQKFHKSVTVPLTCMEWSLKNSQINMSDVLQVEKDGKFQVLKPVEYWKYFLRIELY